MIDAVLSYHLNPMTCGVAKFNHQLAARLGLVVYPCEGLCVNYPLISVKFAECERTPETKSYWDGYDVFAHDAPMTAMDLRLVQRAGRVYAGSKAIADEIREFRPDVIEAFCPSTVQGDPSRGSYRVLAFGMAHKLALEHFRALKQTLELEHPYYTVSLSTAVHEGNPWDEALRQSTNAMREIFGNRLRVLGYLADDALAKELQDCDAVAVYFDPAVRENNTSAWAALSAGKKLYTNTDAQSPELDPQKYSWERLLEVLR